MSYVKMGGRLYDVPEEIARRLHIRKQLAEFSWIDAICLAASVALFVTFVYGTLSLG